MSYFFWLKIFAIYRYILHLEMLAPLLIVLGVGLLPLPRRTQLVALGALVLPGDAVHAQRPYLTAPRSAIPTSTADLPKLADPAHTMVVMTGDAPLGFIAPSLAARRCRCCASTAG